MRKRPISPVARVPIEDEKAYFGLVRRAFQKRRKTLANALAENDNKPGVSAALARAGHAPP